ncbi:MAG: AAA family ATPase [Desulfamplus sp.]|nr:AAA family ATPase [Desulfamplus sp.]
MRFDRLIIPAFGPFTNFDIKFPSQSSDLHLIYGSNEAGKSSLLRAFRDLLFGIHGHSSDNFLHDYKELRIIGEVVNMAGDRLTFQRRKGNKNTLLDGDGDALPDNALLPFLGSVDQAYFSTMFGLGVRELHEGAEQLLRGEGDIGNALFSASLGGTPVQLVLASLIQESERLFKGKATANVSIRPNAKKYKELLKLSRDAAVNPESWENVERELRAAESDKQKLEQDVSKFTRDLEWISRCEDALPTLGRLTEEMRRLELLPLLPDLSSDFVERARLSRKAASDAEAELHRLTNHIAKLETQLSSCKRSPALMAEADTIARLHQNITLYGKKNSLIDLETELAEIELSLNSGMQNMQLTGTIPELEKLRLSSADRLLCEEAATTLQKTVEEHDKNREKIEEIKSQIEAKNRQLKALPEKDLQNLRDALATAAGATDANKTLRVDESEVKRLQLEINDLHKELKGAPDDFDKTGDLPVPAKSTIHKINEEMAEIKRLIKSEETKIADGKRRIESIQAELGRIERRGFLPSEEALRKAREHRDYGWRLVLSDWKRDDVESSYCVQNGSDTVQDADINKLDAHIDKNEFVQGVPLEEAFPKSIADADYIADQLREHAEAVAQVEEKWFQIAKSEQQNREAQESINQLQNILHQSQSSWESVWLPCEIKPLTPVEMDEWREKWSVFKNLLRQLRASEVSLERKVNQIEQAKKQLGTVLAISENNDFELLFEKARQLVQQGEESKGRRGEISEQLLLLNSQLETLNQNELKIGGKKKAVLEMWKLQCAKIGLPEDISPSSGLALLRERIDMLSIFDRWKKLTVKREKKFTEFQQYEQEVKALYKALEMQHNVIYGVENSLGEVQSSSGTKDDTPEAKVSRLWNSLNSAKEAQIRYNQLASQIDESSIELTTAKEASMQAVCTLEELTRLARLDTVEELEPLIANLELKNQIQTRIATLRDTLSALARGEVVDQFISRIKAEDSETLSLRKNALNSLKHEKEGELQNLNDTLYSLKERKKSLEDAGDAASNYRQQAESYAAVLKEDAARFVRLRLAAHFLQTQIERFRKENQGPLLEKSGQIFKSITRGAFAGLGAQFNADDTPVLVGLRSDQSYVPIGGMSDGTRDQLYLALRIAAIDRYLEQHEPMPLILDDLLITFDDERATAIIPQLAELAQRTQIFLFTHHCHLIELCRTTLGKDRFHIHELKNTTINYDNENRDI